MIETEKALDMLPYVVDIYEKLDLASYIKDFRVRSKEKDDIEDLTITQGLNMVAYVLKKASVVKEEIFNIAAIADDKEVDEIKKQPLVSTLKTFKSIFMDKELVNFFKEAMQ